MKAQHLTFKMALVATLFFLVRTVSMAQSISGAEAIPPDPGSSKWTVNVSFVPDPTLAKIKRIFLIDVEDAELIKLENLTSEGKGIYSATTGSPLMTIEQGDPKRLKFARHYELRASVENEKGDQTLSLGAEVELNDPNVAANKEVKAKAKDSDDADIYVSGELNGAHKTRTSFSTEINLQKYSPVSPSWRHTPFFKLNASTDPGADPDKMEMGWRLRYIAGRSAGIPGAYFDQAVKLESERDFGNTNLIYDARLTFLVPAFPKGFKTRSGQDSKITTNNYKVFINPFVGTELGKNLRSPLKSAEGDGISRLLAGADLRVALFLKKGDQPDINWTTSYTRRWLLTDELGFKADDDGVLQLRTFGRSPRDYVISKISYKLTKFFDVFAGYEWGQVPPSYKFVDHRFRFGFAYKYKFDVK